MKLGWLLSWAVVLGLQLPAVSVAADEAVSVTENWTVVHAGNLLAVPGRAPVQQKSVIIKNGVIHDVRDGYIDPASVCPCAKLIDLSDSFVMPGLVDAHVHFTIQFGGYEGRMSDWNSMSDEVILSSSDIALNGAIYARRTLDAGFTTVRDLGALHGEGAVEAIISLRNAINSGKLPGPRLIIAAAPLSPTAGHGHKSGYRSDFNAALSSIALCDGIEACRKITREQISKGAQVIKIMASAGGGDPNGGPEGNAEFLDDEFAEIVKTAQTHNIPIAAHAHGHKAVRAALLAGARTIEHGNYITPEVTRILVDKKAYLVPTLMVQQKRLARAATQSAEIRKDVERSVDIIVQNISTAFRSGARIALGTDAGIIPHGQNAGELVWYTRIGMTPMQALEAGTVNAAAAVGMEDRIGTLELGKMADIIAVKSSPLDDVAVLQNVTFVMKDGIVHKNAP